MAGYRNVSPHGAPTPIFGYIKDGKFIFLDIAYEFELKSDIVTSYSMQTGGMTMVDYIELVDGRVITLTDEIIVEYKSKNVFEKEFYEGEIDYFEAQEKGLLKDVSVSSFPERIDVDADLHEENYQKWVLEETALREKAESSKKKKKKSKSGIKPS